METLVIHSILGILLIVNFSFIVISSYVDYKKKRKIDDFPFISFILATFNDSKYIEATIQSIYKSYKNSRFEIFIINDCSNDNTKEVLKKLKNKYNINIIENKENIGKSASINKTFPKTKGDIIVVADSDIVLNKETFKDIISRFKNLKVGAVSARQDIVNNSLYSGLQKLEYNFISMFQTSLNSYSTLGLFGACMAIRREAFEEAGLLSINAITEDTDLCLKLNRDKWKVKQSLYSVKTYAPENISKLYKQKIRWSSGFIQCFLKYYYVYLTNPIFDFFVLVAFIIPMIFTLSSLGSVVGNSIVSIVYDNTIGKYTYSQILLGMAIYPLFSIPYFILSVKKWKKDYYKILLVYPFTIFYFPFLGFVFFQGIFVGIYKTIIGNKNKAGWRGE